VTPVPVRLLHVLPAHSWRTRSSQASTSTVSAVELPSLTPLLAHLRMRLMEQTAAHSRYLQPISAKCAQHARPHMAGSPPDAVIVRASPQRHEQRRLLHCCQQDPRAAPPAASTACEREVSSSMELVRCVTLCKRLCRQHRRCKECSRAGAHLAPCSSLAAVAARMVLPWL